MLTTWLGGRFPAGTFTLAPASEDASFRRYFRVTAEGKTWVAMDAPPPQEDCRPFVRIAGLMAQAGLNVPEIVAEDLARGFLLLSDLGTVTYLRALTAENAGDLFADATNALIRWQLASRPGVLPPYDEPLLRREMNLFPEWYIARHLGVTLAPGQLHALEDAMGMLAESALAQPRVYVHRDYMPRNLMISTPNPGVLDFQDAVHGPITYDLVSLFRDAFLSWDEERTLDWTVRYWEKARKAGLPVNGDFGLFYRDFEWMGLQRHLKVLGIFARICYRDGKPAYLADAPRFIAYARSVCTRYQPLGRLLPLLDTLGEAGAAGTLAR